MRNWLIKLLGGTPPMTEAEAEEKHVLDIAKVVRKVERLVKSFPNIDTRRLVRAIEREIVKE